MCSSLADTGGMAFVKRSMHAQPHLGKELLYVGELPEKGTGLSRAVLQPPKLIIHLYSETKIHLTADVSQMVSYKQTTVSPKPPVLAHTASPGLNLRQFGRAGRNRHRKVGLGLRANRQPTPRKSC